MNAIVLEKDGKLAISLDGIEENGKVKSESGKSYVGGFTSQKVAYKGAVMTININCFYSIPKGSR